MIKVRDGYGKLIGSNYNGNIAHVLLSNGGNLQYAVGSTASTLVQRNTSGQIESSVASTVAPFVISSTKVNANLNADLLDGFQATGLFQSLTSAADKNLYIKIGNTEKEVSLLYASYLGGVTKEGLFTELTNVNDSTNPNSIKVTIGGTTKYLKIAYSDLASKVVCSSSTNNVDRPIVVTNKSNEVYYSTKVTLNYSTGNVTAPTFTGALIGNADTATTASKLSTVSKTAWGQTYWTSGGVPTSISGDMTGVGNINMIGDIDIKIADSDKFVIFDYDGDKTAGGSWRIGVLGSGSGDANYFVVQSGTSTASATSWNNAIRIDQNTYDAVFAGQLTAKNFVSGDGINDFTAGTVKLDVLNIPTSNGDTTFGPGSNGQVLKSNGTTVYWASDNNSNSWRNIKVNGTQIAGTGTGTYSVDYLSGDGINVTGVAGTSTTKNNTIIITNTGVRSVTLGTGDNVNKLAVNTGGTTTYLTIPYATHSTHLIGGSQGSIPYQLAADTTTFLAAPTTNGYVLKYNTTDKKPYWAADSDTKVTQTNTTGNADYRVLFSATADDTTRTEDARKSTNLKFNPSSGLLTAGGFVKSGSSDSYVLLGGGGHKALSELGGAISQVYIWGQPFNGTANVDGKLTSNVSAHPNIQLNSSVAECSQYFDSSETGYGWAIGTGTWGVNGFGIGEYKNKNTCYLTILQNGNVGIGSINPGQKLVVEGAGIFRNTNTTTFASNGITIGAGDAPERYITCYGKTGTSYINLGYDNGTNNCGELSFDFVSGESAENRVGLGLFGGANLFSLYANRATLKSSLELWLTGNSWNEGIRMHAASNGWSGIVFCDSNNTSNSGTSTNTWSIHNNEGSFYINKNDSSGTTDQLLCNVSGNWGFGINTPANQLHINLNTTLAKDVNYHLDRSIAEVGIPAAGVIYYSSDMTSALGNYKSFIGSAYNTQNDSWWNLISVRHRNGGSDGNKFGMYICASLNTDNNDLCWNKQKNGTWIGERTILDSANYGGYIYPSGYAMNEHIIDATGLNQDTWYPVTINVDTAKFALIEVVMSLWSWSKPYWSTHNGGFYVHKVWYTTGNGWGTTNGPRRLIIHSDSLWCNSDPVRGIGQMTQSSNEYFYVRGGGKYVVRVSHSCTPYLHTSTYSVSDQSVGPTTSTPAGIGAFASSYSFYAPAFYANSDINLKTNIQAITNSNNIPELKEFDWKKDGSHSYGLIAQELEEMGYSELVELNGEYKTVNYSAALSLIVGKLQVKIKELEKQIETLKNKN